MTHLIIATRFWGRKEADFNTLDAFVQRSCKTSPLIIIAINEYEDKVNTAQRLENMPYNSSVDVLKVSPWGGVTHSLNLLLHRARTLAPDYTHILFQSPEVISPPTAIKQLQHIMQQHENTLVVGHALPGHINSVDVTHNISPNCATQYPLRADTCPWNTFALWDAKRLEATGFPSAADMVTPPGMEEVAAIMAQQMIYGSDKRVARLLCSTKGVSWQCAFDRERADKHRRKMKTKAGRSIELMRALGSPDCTRVCGVTWMHFDVIPDETRITDCYVLAGE